MTLAGTYELENTMGPQLEALPSPSSNLITIPHQINILHVFLRVCLGVFQKGLYWKN